MASKSVLLACFALFAVIAVDLVGAQDVCCQPDVVIILDRSYMGPKKYRTYARPLLTNFTQLLPDCADLRAAVVEYATEAQVTFDFATYTPKSTLSEALNVFATSTNDIGFDANLAYAFRAVRLQLLNDNAAGHRPNSPTTVILITGSNAANRTTAYNQALLLKQQNVNIFVVGLGTDYDVDFVRSLASKPEFLSEYPDNDIQDVVNLSNKIYAETCPAGSVAGAVVAESSPRPASKPATEAPAVETTPWWWNERLYTTEAVAEETTQRPSTRRTPTTTAAPVETTPWWWNERLYTTEAAVETVTTPRPSRRTTTEAAVETTPWWWNERLYTTEAPVEATTQRPSTRRTPTTTAAPVETTPWWWNERLYTTDAPTTEALRPSTRRSTTTTRAPVETTPWWWNENLYTTEDITTQRARSTTAATPETYPTVSRIRTTSERPVLLTEKPEVVPYNFDWMGWARQPRIKPVFNGTNVFKPLENLFSANQSMSSSLSDLKNLFPFLENNRTQRFLPGPFSVLGSDQQMPWIDPDVMRDLLNQTQHPQLQLPGGLLGSQQSSFIQPSNMPAFNRLRDFFSGNNNTQQKQQLPVFVEPTDILRQHQYLFPEFDVNNQSFQQPQLGLLNRDAEGFFAKTPALPQPSLPGLADPAAILNLYKFPLDSFSNNQSQQKSLPGFNNELLQRLFSNDMNLQQNQAFPAAISQLFSNNGKQTVQPAAFPGFQPQLPGLADPSAILGQYQSLFQGVLPNNQTQQFFNFGDFFAKNQTNRPVLSDYSLPKFQPAEFFFDPANKTKAVADPAAIYSQFAPVLPNSQQTTLPNWDAFVSDDVFNNFFGNQTEQQKQQLQHQLPGLADPQAIFAQYKNIFGNQSQPTANNGFFNVDMLQDTFAKKNQTRQQPAVSNKYQYLFPEFDSAVQPQAAGAKPQLPGLADPQSVLSQYLLFGLALSNNSQPGKGFVAQPQINTQQQGFTAFQNLLRGWNITQPAEMMQFVKPSGFFALKQPVDQTLAKQTDAKLEQTTNKEPAGNNKCRHFFCLFQGYINQKQILRDFDAKNLRLLQ